MRKLLTLLIFLLPIISQAQYLQNADFATAAYITGAGGTIAQLLNESKIYSNSLSEQYSTAMTSGDLFNSLVAMNAKQLATPANPAAGFNKLYFKADGNLYALNSAGVESLIVLSATQNANNVYAGPTNGAATLPTFRKLVNADIPGVVEPSFRYVDFLDGSDTPCPASPCGDGTINFPWKTLQFAYTSITTATVNRPFVIHIAGGNNDSDVGTIIGKPNISLLTDYTIQITRPITITGGATNDGITLKNLIFIGAFTWIRNDISSIGLEAENCQFFSGPIFKQSGAGSANLTTMDTTTVGLDFLAHNGNAQMYTPTILGTTTFEDSTTSAFYEILGGYNSSAITISGGAELYAAGSQCDVAFGCTLTGVATGNGTPLIQADSGSIPPSIGGAFTLSLIDQANHVAYSPAVPGNWAPAPSQVASALDQLAARTSGSLNVVTKTANFTVTNANDVIIADTTGGTFTLTLQTSASATKKVYYFVVIGTLPVTIATSGGDLLIGQSSQLLTPQYASINLIPDGGTNWYAF